MTDKETFDALQKEQIKVKRLKRTLKRKKKRIKKLEKALDKACKTLEGLFVIIGIMTGKSYTYNKEVLKEWCFKDE